jgi:hypothetical protein
MFRRLCVGGWSYGGMLTDHVIVSDHRFKAAITGASAVLCVSIQIEAAYMICQTRLTAVLDPSLSWHPSIYTQVGLFTSLGLCCGVCVSGTARATATTSTSCCGSRSWASHGSTRRPGRRSRPSTRYHTVLPHTYTHRA